MVAMYSEYQKDGMVKKFDFVCAQRMEATRKKVNAVATNLLSCLMFRTHDGNSSYSPCGRHACAISIGVLYSIYGTGTLSVLYAVMRNICTYKS